MTEGRSEIQPVHVAYAAWHRHPFGSAYIATCVGCRWTAAGAVSAVDRAVERHNQAAEFGSRDGSDV